MPYDVGTTLFKKDNDVVLTFYDCLRVFLSCHCTSSWLKGKAVGKLLHTDIPKVACWDLSDPSGGTKGAKPVWTAKQLYRPSAGDWTS